jgi:hypothetical protein
VLDVFTEPAFLSWLLQDVLSKRLMPRVMKAFVEVFIQADLRRVDGLISCCSLLYRLNQNRSSGNLDFSGFRRGSKAWTLNNEIMTEGIV